MRLCPRAKTINDDVIRARYNYATQSVRYAKLHHYLAVSVVQGSFQAMIVSTPSRMQCLPVQRQHNSVQAFSTARLKEHLRMVTNLIESGNKDLTKSQKDFIATFSCINSTTSKRHTDRNVLGMSRVFRADLRGSAAMPLAWNET